MKLHEELIHKAINKRVRWKCTQCGSKNYQKTIILSKASCKCGIGKGRWITQIYECYRETLNRSERVKDDRRAAKKWKKP